MRVQLSSQSRPVAYTQRGVLRSSLQSNKRGICAFAKKDAKDGSADNEPEIAATSPATPAMTPLQPDPEAMPKSNKPIAALPEEATDTRFADKKIETVLVTGATGGVGKKVVQYLTSKGVEVVAMVKDTVKADKVLPTEHVTVVQGDVYQYTDVQNAVMGVDAVVCASGTNKFIDPFGPFSVDYTVRISTCPKRRIVQAKRIGTVNIVEASKAAGVKQMVLISSIGTDEPVINPANIFWGILFWKKRGEEHLQRSGLPYTIVRPGGLVTDDSDSNKKPRRGKKSTGKGAVVMARAGTYGFPPKKSGSILRTKVAECIGESLVQDSAVNQVVEIVADEQAPTVPWEDLFSGVY